MTWDFGYCLRWNRLGNPVISWELLRHSASGTLGIALSRHVRTFWDVMGLCHPGLWVLYYMRQDRAS